MTPKFMIKNCLLEVDTGTPESGIDIPLLFLKIKFLKDCEAKKKHLSIFLINLAFSFSLFEEHYAVLLCWHLLWPDPFAYISFQTLFKNHFLKPNCHPTIPTNYRNFSFFWFPSTAY